MTIDEFIAALEKTPRDWYWSALIPAWTGQLPMRGVSDKWRCCDPLMALASKMHSTSYLCGIALGLANEDCHAILDACYLERGFDSALRARIIKACGLEEPERKEADHA